MLVLTRDRERIAEYLDLLAATWEIAIDVAASPQEAQKLLHRNHPDLLAVDHPEAAEFLHQVRQDRPRESFLPALILLADDDREVERAGLMSGADDFLRIPIDPFEGLLRTHNLLSLRETRLRLQRLEGAIDQQAETFCRKLCKARLREQTKIQQNRLSALGTMASGVAHDFNNVLAVVRGFAEHMLRLDLKLSDKDRRQHLESIVTAAEDGSRIVHRLREFNRPRESADVRQALDLNALVEQSVDFTRSRWGRSRTDGKNVVVRTELCPVLPIPGDPSELREMMINLIFNAVDAMPAGGLIMIRTGVECGQVILEVTDTGTGMPERVRQRCLEPFFTTKGEKGTGMGLAMVHGIAQRHGATLDLDSEVGRGTTFRFRFGGRVSKRARQQQTASKNLAPSPVRQLKVLVVDDEPIICDLLAEMLNYDGHRVQRVYGSEEALVATEREYFDLVVTDREMPKMDGIGLANAIKAVHPETRILLVSGHQPDETTPWGIDHTMTKPVTFESLRRGVAETIGQQHLAAVA